jgi:hypothetical protein
MPSDAPPEPWRSLLHELDAAAARPVDLVCIGGFVLTAVYDAPRTTADLDVLPAVNDSRAEAILQLARRDGDLHRRFGVYIDPVTVVTPLENFEARLGEVFGGAFRRIRLLAPGRREMACAISQARPCGVAQALHELRPYETGPDQRHDLTMELWVEMIEEVRSRRS